MSSNGKQEKDTITIALAGNPNAGKTTLFNNITGTRQKVGNWPGVTVEKKEGQVDRFGHHLTIIDLPGTYSLTPFSIEEIITRDFILDGGPDVVIDIIDASNLERSLYLATQLRELDTKVLFALNMADLAASRGVKINVDKLEALLKIPVVFTVGNKNQGTDDLIKKAIELSRLPEAPHTARRVKYSSDIEDRIMKLQDFISAETDGRFPYNLRWTAIKLLENDEIIRQRILEHTGPVGETILEQTQGHRDRLSTIFNDDPEIVMTDERYGFIAGIIKETVTISTRRRVDISRNIDLLLTNRFFGFPIFIFFIWGMFQLTFSLGEYPMGWIEDIIHILSTTLGSLMPEGWYKDLLIKGVVAGVGSVIVFLPNILILFFCISLFEDTGYMARAAFLMDKVMHLIGLHGKSFIPMLMGFGCNVPAVMATRTLESEKDRILTILITPFMSCSAKLPVYIVLTGTFFAAKAGSVIFMIYLTGILLSVLTGRLFRSTLFRGVEAPFVMELPPYRVPMLKSLLIHMWDRSKIFLRKMGGVILIGSIVIWGLSNYPQDPRLAAVYKTRIESVQTAYLEKIRSAPVELKEQLEKEREVRIADVNKEQKARTAEHSFIGRMGKFIAPLFAPIGIDWRGGVALVSGFVAKEIVVSTMGVLYAAGADDPGALGHALTTSGMTPLSALSMMVFVLLYLPCLATIFTIRRETGSIRWMFFSIIYSTGMAWIASLIVFQGGKLFGFE